MSIKPTKAELAQIAYDRQSEKDEIKARKENEKKREAYYAEPGCVFCKATRRKTRGALQLIRSEWRMGYDDGPVSTLIKSIDVCEDCLGKAERFLETAK